MTRAMSLVSGEIDFCFHRGLLLSSRRRSRPEPYMVIPSVIRNWSWSSRRICVECVIELLLLGCITWISCWDPSSSDRVLRKHGWEKVAVIRVWSAITVSQINLSSWKHCCINWLEGIIYFCSWVILLLGEIWDCFWELFHVIFISTSFCRCCHWLRNKLFSISFLLAESFSRGANINTASCLLEIKFRLNWILNWLLILVPWKIGQNIGQCRRVFISWYHETGCSRYSANFWWWITLLTYTLSLYRCCVQHLHQNTMSGRML